MNTKNKTILLVGGGTGGHIMPILTIRKELLCHHENKLNIVTVGGNSPIDQKLYAGLSNHLVLVTGKLHRSVTIDNLFQFILLIWGFVSALIILKRIKPGLIFSKAGYVSLPIIFWSKVLKLPYFIHESDIVMGASNRFAADRASMIFVGFPQKYYPDYKKEQIEYTGQIIKSDLGSAKDSQFDFGFENKKPIIFVTGGSQGARNINNAIFQILDEVLLDYNIIHHTGNLDYGKAIEKRTELTNKTKSSYFISPLLLKTAGGIDMMKSAISQATIVISRASATTLAEVSLAKKPIILVPYKYAAADHQSKNALYYKDNGAAVVISDDNLSGESLKKQIENLLSHSEKREEMGRRAYDLQLQDGLSKIVGEIERFLSSRKCDKV